MLLAQPNFKRFSISKLPLNSRKSLSQISKLKWVKMLPEKT
jgi:hypothetical protein